MEKENIIFKQASTPEELNRIADLIGKTFGRRSYFEFYEKMTAFHRKAPLFKPEHCFIAKDNDKVVSHIGIIEKEIHIGKSGLKTAGIGDVVTNPEYRGLGLSKQIMLNAIEYMEKKEYPLSLLYGIPNYYHKFDFIEAFGEYTTTVKTKDIPETELPDHLEIINWSDELTPRLKVLYDTEFQNCPGKIDRPEAYFYCFELLRKSVFAVHDKSAGKIIGYAFYMDEYSNEFIVKEVGTENREVYKYLLTELKRRAEKFGADEIPVYMGPETKFARYLKQFGAINKARFLSEGKGGPMGRIVDYPVLFKALEKELQNRIRKSCFVNNDFEFILHPVDSEEDILVANKSGKLSVSRITQNQSGNSFKMEINRSHFSRVILGYWNMESYLNYMKAELPESDLLDFMNALFPEYPFYILKTDYF